MSDLGDCSLILAAHGSGAGSTVNEEILDFARAAGTAGGFAEVRCVFHRGARGFGEALAGLRARRAVVVPLFTSNGFYVQEVLPRELAASDRNADLRWALTEPVGTLRVTTTAVATQARKVASWAGLTPPLPVVVVGHGTARNAHSRLATERLADELARASWVGASEAFFLDEEPRIEVAAGRSWDRALVVPFLLAGGGHLRRDLPRRLGFETVETERLPALWSDGERHWAACAPLLSLTELPRIVVDLARRAASAL